MTSLRSKRRSDIKLKEKGKLQGKINTDSNDCRSGYVLGMAREKHKQPMAGTSLQLSKRGGNTPQPIHMIRQLRVSGQAAQ